MNTKINRGRITRTKAIANAAFEEKPRYVSIICKEITNTSNE